MFAWKANSVLPAMCRKVAGLPVLNEPDPSRSRVQTTVERIRRIPYCGPLPRGSPRAVRSSKTHQSVSHFLSHETGASP